MLSIFKTAVPLCVLLFVSLNGNAQLCHYQISGQVFDSQKLPVAAVVVRLVNDTITTTTDTAGKFIMPGICPGQHLVAFEALGYKTVSFTTDIKEDKNLKVILTADESQLSEVVINGEKLPERALQTVTAATLKGTALLETRGQTLGETLKSLPGLNSIQTGPSLSKPVIHGLHSNRVLILNNGVRQEGQQWGSEHAPEIDPFVSERITVIKGAASIRYGADAIAGVILLDPPVMRSTPGLNGDVYTVAASNGRMGALSATLDGMQDKGLLKGLSWRVQGTLKEAGNFSTAHYYLANTGLKEADFSATATYTLKGWESKLFVSSYNTKIGIFEGSHVGNINDLYASFARAKPLTPDSFYYHIGRSYQTVNHNIIKLSETKQISEGKHIEANVSYQTDLRNEYDIDVPYSSNPAVLNAPQISFRLNTVTADLTYIVEQGHGLSGTVGVMGSTQGNIFQGLRYLIPNFRNYSGGIFAIEKWQMNRLLLEAGVRYDYESLHVYRENLSALSIYTSSYHYQNPTATAGATYSFSDAFHANLNFGTAWRAPSINELYIQGIHLSAASYEIGDSSLHSEHAFNTSLSLNYHKGPLDIVADFYDNEINDFIFASPTLKPITLITGTYPSFQYVQTNARIRGMDIDAKLTILKHLDLISKTTIVRGWNKNINDWLIFMPADRFQNGFSIHANSIGKRIKSPYLSVENVTVLQQTRVPPNSDYVAPPPGYNLFNANIGCTVSLGTKLLNLDLGVQNFTNVAYRDYLNRFRYYADDLGINFALRAKLSF